MSNPEYNDLITATISNNILTVEYKDNINNVEYSNLYASINQINFPLNLYLLTQIDGNITYETGIKTNDDKLILLYSDSDNSSLRVIRLNNSNNYEEFLQFLKTIVVAIENENLTKIIIYGKSESVNYKLSYIQIDNKNRLIMIGTIPDYSGYVLSRININMLMISQSFVSPILDNFDLENIGILDNQFGDSINGLYYGYTQQPFPVINSITYNDIFNITADYKNRIIIIFKNNNNYVIRRFTENGQIDNTFQQILYNNSSNTFIILDSNPDNLGGFYLLSLGNLVNQNTNTPNIDTIIKKYYADGTEDTSFMTNFESGTDDIYYKNLRITYNAFKIIIKYLYLIPKINTIEKLEIDNNDKILIVSSTTDNPPNAIISRFNENGDPDKTLYNGSTYSYYIVNNNYGFGFNNYGNIMVDSHNNIILGYDFNLIVEEQINQAPSITLYNDNGIINNKSRYYNQISVDNGMTFRYMNNTNKNVNQNGKNTLTVDLNNIPNINNRNYAIQLKTSDGEMTNIITLNNNESVSQYQFELVLSWMSKLFGYMARLKF